MRATLCMVVVPLAASMSLPVAAGPTGAADAAIDTKPDTAVVKAVQPAPEPTSSAVPAIPVQATTLPAITVNFGGTLIPHAHGSAPGFNPSILSGVAAQDRMGQTDEMTNLGVAAEGVRVGLGKVGNFSVGMGEQFRFHRDAVYDPQAYLRAREIELGAGSAQGASSVNPRK